MVTFYFPLHYQQIVVRFDERTPIEPDEQTIHATHTDILCLCPGLVFIVDAIFTIIAQAQSTAEIEVLQG